jgi:hypothetical protein
VGGGLISSRVLCSSSTSKSCRGVITDKVTLIISLVVS